MAKLQDFFILIIVYFFVTLGCLAAFGYAVKYRIVGIAPRCHGRPRDVIYNPNARKKKKKRRNKRQRNNKNKNKNDNDDVENGNNNNENEDENDDDDDYDNDKKHPQDRGSPMFGWILWSLSLSYETMLNGVPGTGTRNNGLDGNLIKINLDQMLCLRFTSICQRISIFASIIYLLIVMPINITGGCNKILSLNNETIYEKTGKYIINNDTLKNLTGCSSTLTNYEITTIANIPSLTIDVCNDEFYYGNGHNINCTNIHGRLCVIALCTWIVSYYTCKLLAKEWIDLLAIRRKYYLESDEMNLRLKYLQNTLLNDNNIDNDMDNHHINQNHINQRPPYIPHPETADTVPNIEMYSVLISNIPSDPNDAPIVDVEKSIQLAHKHNIDWQLAVTATYLDRCVPNQPGFTSSIAAITILPGSTELKITWNKWSTCASKQRKLFFIRSILREKGYTPSIDESDMINKAANTISSRDMSLLNNNFSDDDDNDNDNNDDNNEKERRPFGKSSSSDDDDNDEIFHDASQDQEEEEEEKVEEKEEGHNDNDDDNKNNDDRPNMVGGDGKGKSGGAATLQSTKSISPLLHRRNVTLKRAAYRKSVRNFDYYSRALGSTPNQSSEAGLLHEALTSYGPEQMNVYAREYAQSAAGCAPNGYNERRYYNMTIDELLLEEEDAIISLEEAYDELRNAREKCRPAIKPIESSSRHANLYADELTSKYDNIPQDIPEEEEEQNNKNNDSRSSSDDEDQDVTRKSTVRFSPSSDEVYEIERAATKDNNDNDNADDEAGSNSSSGDSGDGEKEPFLGDIETADNTASNIDVDDDDDDDDIPNESVLLTVPQAEINEDKDWGTWKAPSIKGATNFIKKRSLRIIKNKSSSLAANVSNRAGNSIKNNKARANEVVNKAGNSLKGLENKTKQGVTKTTKKAAAIAKKSGNELLIATVKESTYAAVTFTSRQAAVAARQCLMDGSSNGQWRNLNNVPVAPLADASACSGGRNTCRPVSVSIPASQKSYRQKLTIAALVFFCFLYIIPLTFIMQWANPENWKDILPDYPKYVEKYPLLGFLSTALPAVVLTVFFASIPQLFKALANSGSGATSVAEAEYSAIKYYWWFMNLSAFWGTTVGGLIAKIVTEGFKDLDSLSEQVQTTIKTIVDTIPTDIAPTWMTWMITRALATLPINYLFMLNTFLFGCLGIQCLSRANKGGGPGGPMPYRIFIDNGFVILCTAALAPVSPLVAPAALLTFLVISPILRRNFIFVYRPKYDSGGLRWPFLFSILTVCLVTGHVVLTAIFALKLSIPGAVLAALPILPIYLFYTDYNSRYLRSYQDASLFHTSHLDGWDPEQVTTMYSREEFRNFLVDSHKAAYVPLCIAGTTPNQGPITVEPAVVVPLETDTDKPKPPKMMMTNSSSTGDGSATATTNTPSSVMSRRKFIQKSMKSQIGSSFRRVSMNSTPAFYD